MTEPHRFGAPRAALSRLLNAQLTFWVVLALPAVPLLHQLLFGNIHRLLAPSGLYAVRFLIATLLIAPLALLFPGVALLRWLKKRRRALGVASFGYAALHTLAYVLDEGAAAAMLAALPDPAIWTGWLAFLILFALAAISNDAALRRLGPWWKPVQRLAYLAAVLVAVHWVSLQYHFGPMLVHFLALAVLSLWRLGRWRKWWGRDARPG